MFTVTQGESKMDEKTRNEIRYCFPRTGERFDDRLLDLIDQTKHSFDLAIFTFTDTAFMNALLRAQRRGVAVRIITDRLMALTLLQHYILNKLKKAGIPIKKRRHAGFMHLKLSISDSKTATVASANLTKSAQKKNDEIFMQFNDEELARGIAEQFERMWRSERDFSDF